MKQTKSLWYAVSKTGQGCIFTEKPERNDDFGVFEARIEGCYSMVVADFEANGLCLPDMKYSDEPIELKMTIEYG